MSFQPQEFAPSGPVRRESALQRQMAEFDAKKAAEAKSVRYSDDAHERSPSSKAKRNGTPHPKSASPHAPPSPDRDGAYAVPSRRDTHTPPRDEEYQKNIHTTGGNGRDKEEKWVGNDLPQPRLHGNPESDLSYADNLACKYDKKTGDHTVEWNGAGQPPIRHHHQWTDDDVKENAGAKDGGSKSRKSKTKKYKNADGDYVEEADESEPEIRAHHDWKEDSEAQAAYDKDSKKSKKSKKSKTKKYKNADGDYVEEADGSDTEIRAHHDWKEDSEAQAAYDKDSKKSKKSKSSRRSSREENDRPYHSGDSDSEIVTYIDKNGDEVKEARNPDNTTIRHNHQWTD